MNSTLQSRPQSGTIEIYGASIIADFSLGSLPAGTAGTAHSESDHHPAIQVRIHPEAPTSANIYWLPQRSSPDQFAEWYSVGRIDDKYLLRFDKTADFQICLQSSSIDCYPAPDTDIETLQHLLLNQALPRLLAQRGATVLHASAVSIDGLAIAFTGNTGAGKSTFATRFCNNGASLMADDCLVVDISSAPPQAIPAYPGIRLHEDGWSQIPDSIGKARPAAQYTSKLFLGNDQLPFPFCSRPQDLNCVFQLTPSENSDTPITITTLSKRDAHHCLVENSFRLDFTDHACLSREFHQLVNLSQKLPVFNLSYPRSWDRIDEVRDAVLQHTQSVSRPVAKSNCQKIESDILPAKASGRADPANAGETARPAEAGLPGGRAKRSKVEQAS